jgi:sulfite reductase (NADPH) flavoprotein alpha-component
MLGYSREAPVDAIFRSAARISGQKSEKDTRHVVFDISKSGIDYVPGDSFGIVPLNEPALADAVLAAMRAPADFPVEGPGGTKPFRQALIEDYALGAAPDMLFELISYMVGGARRQKAKLLAKGGDPDGDAATLDVLAALEKFGPLHPDPEAFLECLDPLQPRLYSISSSPLATPGELHLTVDTVRYQVGDRRRLGVGSTFLADRLKPGAKLKVYLQKAHGFGLPTDPKTPMIMVGPGTGVAPFRSFLWHRAATKAKGDAWLFYGHQREATEFFYRSEFEGHLQNGTLTKLSTAWSRDGANKVYVQDRMREAGPELWAWLKRGAHFYVCGDAKRMAKDVEEALVAVAHQHGHMSEAGARDFLAELKAAKRYAADVY